MWANFSGIAPFYVQQTLSKTSIDTIRPGMEEQSRHHSFDIFLGTFLMALVPVIYFQERDINTKSLKKSWYLDPRMPWLDDLFV